MLRSRFNRLMASGLIAATGLSPQRTLAQAAPQPLRLGAAANETYAQAYYAQDMGFYHDAGLSVEITTMVSGAAIVAGVVGGALDIGGAAVSAIANSHLRGLPIYLVAPGGVYSTTSPTSGLIVAKTSPIRKAADFSGKTVAVTTLRDVAQTAVMSWLDQNGGDSSKALFIELPAAERWASPFRAAASTELLSPNPTSRKQWPTRASSVTPTTASRPGF